MSFQSIIAFSSPLVYDLHPIQPSNTTKEFEPKPYIVSPALERYHNAWRFGHTNNFTDFVNGVLTEGYEDEATDYVAGIIATSSMILLLSILWTIVIFILKCAGPKKVGFLAGRLIEPIPALEKSERESSGYLSVIQEEDESLDTNVASSLVSNEHSKSTPFMLSNIEEELLLEKQQKKFGRKVTAVRATFLLSGLCVIIAGSVYYGKAVKSFNNSFDEVRHGTSDIRGKILEALNISHSILSDEERLIKTVDAIQVKIPIIDQLCSSKPFVGNFVQPIIDQFQDATAQIEQYNKLLHDYLTSANEAMDSIDLITKEMDTAVDEAQKWFIICVWVSTFFFIVVVVMLVGCLMVIYQKSNCLTKFTESIWLWPLFSILLFLVWVFATMFLAASLSGSDICVEPDEIVYTALADSKPADGIELAVYKNLVNYVTGCTMGQAAIVPDNFTAIDEISKIHEKSEELQEVTKQIASPTLRGFVDQCGINETDIETFQYGANQLHDFSHLLANGYYSFENEILSCSAMNPIYTKFMHDAFCSEAVQGAIIWSYSTTLFVALFSLLMAMFRAAMYPIKRSTRRTYIVDEAGHTLNDSGVIT